MDRIIIRILWVTGTLLFFLPSNLCGQGYSIIEYEGVQVVPALAGIVYDPADAPMAGVLVEEFSSDWKTKLRSTKTNEQGRFAMAAVKDRKIYFLQFSFPNCNPIRMRLKVDIKHGKDLQVKMVNST